MRRGFTLLVAEDNDNDAMFFAHAVQAASAQAGIKIDMHRVRDGTEAIAYLSGKGEFADKPFPDLMVLDLKMPLMDGLDVLAWLAAHPQYRRLPKIMLSGSGLEEDVERAYMLGVTTYFEKPGALVEFRELISHMILYWSHTKRPALRRSAAGRVGSP
jgi:CheY-like chemotaxis protein